MAGFRALSNCFLLAIALWAAPAHAAIDKAGAAKLKTMMEKTIAGWAAHMEGRGEELVLDGPVMVEPNGTYYAVTIPGMKIGDMDGARVEMGMVAINAMPAARPDQWKMTVALPTPMTGFDEDQAVSWHITIGKQNLAGIWQEAMNGFVKLSAAYGDIVVMDAAHKPMATIKNIEMSADFNESAAGDWSGPFEATVKGLALSAPDGTRASLDKFTLRSVMKDYSLRAAQDYETKINALNESYDAGEGEDMSGQHLLALYNLITEFMANGWESMELTAGIEGLAIAEDDSTTAVKNATIGLALGGFRSNSVFLNVKAGYEGLSGQEEQNAPHSIGIDMGVGNLPYRELVALGRNAVQMTAAVPQEGVAKMAILTALMTAPQVLTDAKSSFTVRDLSMKHPLYDIIMNGMATANIKATMGATGHTTLRIRGMDALMEDARTRMSDPATAPEHVERLQRLTEVMTIMQVASTKQNAPDGQVIHVLNFEIAEDGKIILNGTDMSALLGGGTKKKN